MFDTRKIPSRIMNRISGLTWDVDTMGQSGSAIMLFDKMVLKIQGVSRSSINEIVLLNWLDGKLPVPAVIEAETLYDTSYLLMSRLPGEMACSHDNMKNMDRTVRALADGLKMLWDIDTSACPCTNTVADKLIQGKYSVENDLVNVDAFEPETLSSGGFSDVPDLYRYLDENRPCEDRVFAHGDFCLPNVFISGGYVSGFLDWGNGGIADRWQDIALCARSLKHNYLEQGGHSDADFQKYRSLLFYVLGIEPDEEKIRYYTLLDELF